MSDDDWDVEETEIPTIGAPKVASKWDDEDQDDDVKVSFGFHLIYFLQDSWDAESDDEKKVEPVKKASPPPPKKKTTLQQKLAARKEQEQAEAVKRL
jgi:hypothetical protein